jgi:hypothetical protein
MRQRKKMFAYVVDTERGGEEMIKGMKCRILVIEYPEEKERELDEVLSSVSMKTINTAINTGIGEITSPYHNADDDFIDDIIDLLLFHNGNTNLISDYTKIKPYLPRLIQGFSKLRAELVPQSVEGNMRVRCPKCGMVMEDKVGVKEVKCKRCSFVMVFHYQPQKFQYKKEM